MNKLSVIARHEIRVRFFSKMIGFNLLILLVVVCVAPWIPKIISSENPTSIGIYAASPTTLSETVALQESLKASAKSQGFPITFIEGASLKQLKSGLGRSGFSIVLQLTPTNYSIVTLQKGNLQILAFLTSYSQALVTSEFLTLKGLNSAEFQNYLATHGATIESQLEASDELTEEQYFTSMILSLLLFTLIILASSHLVMGVVEEKSSHVMEIILYSIKPRQLLLGKLTGISLFIFLQFILLIGAGYLSATYAGIAEQAHLTLSSALIILLWFPPAFLFFAIAYSAIGARASRVEDLGSVQAPLMLLVSASLYSSIFAVNTPDAQWVEILTYIPPFSFFIESSRTLLGISNGAEQLTSWLIAFTATITVGIIGIKSFEKRVTALH
jgi:ABC-2 type transport system permease protein